MKSCPVCHRCYEDAAAVCVKNHGTLRAERAGTLEMIPNYRLDSVLERDAVGESYLATSVTLDQPFVIKIIAQNLLIAAGEQARQMLEREVQAAAALNHLNFARVYEFGWLDGGAFYIVTEPVGDKTLQGLLRNTGALSEIESVKIARQTAEGLMAAHAAGIIHRAVSPANIILTRNSQSQLIIKLRNFDFGGIKQHVIAGKSVVDKEINTLRYLSPEQFRGKSADAQTDVYSLGIVLYEMLCGRSPFDAPTAAAIADQQIDEQPLSQLRFDVRALLTHTIKESLQKRPAARLQMGNFARQLRHITQLILPLGENLPAAPQVLLSNEVTPDAPKFIESPHEVITLDRINTVSANEIDEQPNVVKIEENEADGMPPMGELAPVFIMKNEADIDSLPVKALSVEGQDTNFDSFESNPVIEENRVDEVPFDANIPQTDETAPNENFPLGELAPVFVMKDAPETDLLKEEMISFETADANFDSVESNSILADQKQVNETLLESDVAPNKEMPTTEITPLGELAPVFFEKNRNDEISFESEPISIERETIDAAATAPKVFVFPEENVENSRNAETAAPSFTNYSDERDLPRRPLAANRSALVGAGLIAVLISTMLGAFLYNRMQHPAVSEQATADAPTTNQTSSDTKNDTAKTTLPNEPELENSAPITVEKTPLTASKSPAQKLPEETITIPAAKQNEPTQERTASEKSAATNGKPRTELNSALDNWISATNSRDVEQQMNYYAPKLNAYYLTRNASQGTVRAEKKRIFSRADEVDIQAGKPDITLSPDGQKATMRFRKKYDIRQGQQNRSGEVIQELQWVKSGDGWRIVSERDVKIINR